MDTMPRNVNLDFGVKGVKQHITHCCTSTRKLIMKLKQQLKNQETNLRSHWKRTSMPRFARFWSAIKLHISRGMSAAWFSKRPVTAVVSGISQTTLPIKQRCELRIHSQYNNFTQVITCLVIGSISEELPSEEVDLLLGAGIFWTLLCIGQHRVGKGSLLLLKTVLGWVMTGTAAGIPNTNEIACHFGRDMQVQNQLELFWKIEESKTILNLEEEPPEIKKNVNVFMTMINKYKFPFKTFSDVMKMKRVMVYILRYIHNCRLSIREVSTKRICSTEELKEAIRNSASISTEELEEATKRLIKLCQQEEFREE
ncbi:hypothetical protein CBL_20086, partial [Carabus blaptoides fortunei]